MAGRPPGGPRACTNFRMHACTRHAPGACTRQEKNGGKWRKALSRRKAKRKFLGMQVCPQLGGWGNPKTHENTKKPRILRAKTPQREKSFVWTRKWRDGGSGLWWLGPLQRGPWTKFGWWREVLLMGGLFLHMCICTCACFACTCAYAHVHVASVACFGGLLRWLASVACFGGKMYMYICICICICIHRYTHTYIFRGSQFLKKQQFLHKIQSFPTILFIFKIIGKTMFQCIAKFY